MIETDALIAAYGSYGHTEAIQGGIAVPGGPTVQRVTVEPIIGAYRRMIRDLEFDICELAPVTYLIARSRGAPMKALPVFLSRAFHHGDVVCRVDAGIDHPKDLEGKRFGVRAYTVTTGVWIRGMLQDRFGVDLDAVEWVVDDEDHVEGLHLPPNVTRLPAGQSIADAFATGDIHAAVKGIAGVGRKGSPMRAWSESEIAVTDGFEYHELIDDPIAAAAEDYDRDGVYPMHRALVVKDEAVAGAPDLPSVLFDAFNEAKEQYVDRILSDGATATADDAKYVALAEIVGGDPLPYGLKSNRASIEKLTEYGASQGLLPPNLDVTALFHAFDP